jgi:hypothetical protein
MVLRPAIPAAVPRKLRRDVFIGIETLLLMVNVNSTPWRAVLERTYGFNAETQRARR